MAGLFQRQLERAPSIGVIFDHGDYTVKTGDIFTSAKGLAAGEHLQGILLMHDVICWPSGPASHPLPAARAAAMKSICRQGLLQDSSRVGGGGVCIAEAERWHERRSLNWDAPSRESPTGMSDRPSGPHARRSYRLRDGSAMPGHAGFFSFSFSIFSSLAGWMGF